MKMMYCTISRPAANRKRIKGDVGLYRYYMQYWVLVPGTGTVVYSSYW